MENVVKPAIRHTERLQDCIMVLQLAISSFELQYERFMDKNAKDSFDSIKNAANSIANSIR